VKPVAAVLVVDDDDAFRGVLVAELTRMHFEATGVATADEAIRHVARHEPEIALLDLRLGGDSGLDVLRRIRETSPATDIIILTGHGTIDTAVDAMRLGAFDYLAKPCPLDELDVRIRRALDRQSLQRRATLLERGLTPPDLGSAFIGDSPEFRRLLHVVNRVAPADSTVLISGETGTGKEMVAKLLHARSARRNRPFVVVECASLNDALLQSELFGHERGAFTGAERAKPGLFEVAHGGTIFLDEIGEISVATQVTLLRVLDTSTFRHVGGTHEIHVDVRVIAATNRDLPALVRQGLFREDLYYRLATVVLALPSLRARGADIDLLARHFVVLLSERFGVNRSIGDAALDVLRRHDWPGNVRELLHVIEAAIVVSEGPEILPEHLPATVRRPARAQPGDEAHDQSLLTLEKLEQAHIETVLRASRGHRGHAARVLGISERNLYRKLRTYGLLE
jgi:DNA-binding NtrC family response regulator